LEKVAGSFGVQASDALGFPFGFAQRGQEHPGRRVARRVISNVRFVVAQPAN